MLTQQYPRQMSETKNADNNARDNIFETKGGIRKAKQMFEAETEVSQYKMFEAEIEMS